MNIILKRVIVISELAHASKPSNLSLEARDTRPMPFCSPSLSNTGFPTTEANLATSRSQVHFDNQITMRSHTLHQHSDSMSPPNLSQTASHPLMPLGSDSSASYSSSSHLGSNQHLTSTDNISMNSDTSNQLDMHQLSHDQMDRNTRLAQSSLDLNSHVQTFQQHSNSQQHLQQQQHHLQQHPHHQLPSFQSHQSSNTALYNSGQGIGSSTGDFSSYGPMYQYYSNLNKCRPNPYQRPSSNNSAAAQAVAAQAAVAAQYPFSVFSSYPGFNTSAGNLSSSDGSSSATAASLAAALRPHSYDYSGATPSGLSSLPR